MFSDEKLEKPPCLCITSSDYALHSTCGNAQGTASLQRTVGMTNQGFRYRTLWGYAMLPVVVPLGVAVDIIAIPFYVAVYITVVTSKRGICDRDIDKRRRTAQLLAFDWPSERESRSSSGGASN